MKIISWNVNGIRAVTKKGFIDFVKKENPNILCLQEIKIDHEWTNLTNDTNLKDYKVYWNFAKKPGYSGTAIFINHEWTNDTNYSNSIQNTKYKLLDTSFFGDEGRVITLEFDKFYLINAYFPHSRRGLERLDFKLEFNEKFLEFSHKLYAISHLSTSLEARKPIIICGDFNVAHKEIDLANPKQNQKNAGFLPQERAWMDKLLDSGYVDTFRAFTKEGGHYTWWSHFANARARNIGWRIDYFIISQELRPKLQSSKILPQIMGSDHAPIVMNIDF